MSAAARALAPLPEVQPAAWYGLYTQASREKAARKQLQASGIEVFWPHYLKRVKWGQRRQVVRVETSLFPGYLFARFDPARQMPVIRNTPGVSFVIGVGARPIAIDEELIETMRRACSNPALVSPAAYYQFAPGERVTVATGPFAGLTGTVDRSKGRARVIVTIEILKRACAVEVGAAELLKADK